MADLVPLGYSFCPMNTPSNTPACRSLTTARESRALPVSEWLVADPAEHDQDGAGLAHAVWEKNGRLPGRQRQYRQEVDAQLRATRHWLEQDLSSRASPGPDASPLGGI